MSSESVPGPDSRVRLVLWRHGQTPWNVQGRFQGQTDIQLDEVGVEQAERAARLLAALRPDVIISSDPAPVLATAVGKAAVPAEGADRDHGQGLAGTPRRGLGRPDFDVEILTRWSG